MLQTLDSAEQRVCGPPMVVSIRRTLCVGISRAFTDIHIKRLNFSLKTFRTHALSDLFVV